MINKYYTCVAQISVKHLIDEERVVKQKLNREQFLQRRRDKLAKEAQKMLDVCF